MCRSRLGVGALLLGGAASAGCLGPHAMTADVSGRTCAEVASAPARGVAWWSPRSIRDRRSLDHWCNGAGPVVADTIPRWSAYTTHTADSLRVLVWNVSAGGGDLVRFLREQAGMECGAPSARPFVLLAQEAYRRSPSVPAAGPGVHVSEAAAERSRSTPREDIVALAARCGLALVYAPAVRNGDADFPDGREDRGNAILANVPLADPIVIELPAEDSRRLALAATLRHPAGDSVRVVTMHLTLLPRLWRNLTTGNAARVRHALGLIDALAGIEGERGDDIATVAAGDANSWSTQDAALRRLRDAFPGSPEPLDGGTRGPFPADHLFFRAAPSGGGEIVLPTYRLIPDDYGSDHLPLAVTFRFSR